MKIDIGDTKGLRRIIDEQNRIVIPVEFRKQLGVGKGGKLEMWLLEEGLYIKKCD